MLKDITLGQYFPGSSVIHRLDPRTKLIITVAFIVFIFIVRDFGCYVLGALFLSGVVAASAISPRMVLRSLKPLLVIIILTAALNIFYTGGTPVFTLGFLTVTREGIRLGIIMMLRLIFLGTATAMLTYTTSPIMLTDALENLMRPLKKIGVPVGELSMMMTIAMRFIPTLIEETDKIISAQKARGADFDTGNILRRVRVMIPILVPLFISAFRRADELAAAMESRCYRGGVNRTRLKQLCFTRIDVCAFLFSGAMFAAMLCINNLSAFLR